MSRLWELCIGMLVATCAALGDCGRISAAVITWGEVFTIDDPSDISRPPGSSNVAAIDFNTPAAFFSAGGDNVINGIPFGLAGVNVGWSFDSGPVYDSANFPDSTGDKDLDDLLDSYVYKAGDPATSAFSIAGLTVGGQYQIQLIGIADASSTGQTYEPDDGAGNFNTGVAIVRGAPQSVIGTFTADSPSEGVQFRSLNFAPGNADPGLAGLVIRRLNAVPEPGSLALCGIASAALLASRRRKRRLTCTR